LGRKRRNFTKNGAIMDKKNVVREESSLGLQAMVECHVEQTREIVMKKETHSEEGWPYLQ